MSKTIRIKNELPHIIDALWHHPDCPKWLQDDLWDAINDRTNAGTAMTPNYWASQLESCEPDKEGEHDARYGFPAEKSAFEDRESGDWPEQIH